MTEKEWVALVIERLRPLLAVAEPELRLAQSARLVYAEEIRAYRDQTEPEHYSALYETDLLITEKVGESAWIPRLVVEAKIDSVMTHDAITYSQKAATHKAVHPYLRYGIILGHRRHYPLPGRLVRHGAHFDFMQSWVDFEPTGRELADLVGLMIDEVRASRALEEIIYGSRRRGRKRYTILHRPLWLKPVDETEVTNDSQGEEETDQAQG